ncbi:MAG: sulfurtransferase complex subunit TusB [Gammaproteobacteria bacterium]|nr:sulfurtransferase complex subunit TusB [Gammaproteobacteria bacterium]NVK87371.1 sulfurtransferase complex subunit TusB [Gammaproteobacteria bacterium]
MSCLHLVNRPLAASHLKQLQQRMTEQDALIMIEDACYMATDSELSELMSEIKPYLLQIDASIRGIEPRAPYLNLVADYGELVELTLTFDKVLTWAQ